MSEFDVEREVDKFTVELQKEWAFTEETCLAIQEDAVALLTRAIDAATLAELERAYAVADGADRRSREQIRDLEARLDERESFLRQCEQICQREMRGIQIRESGIEVAPYVVCPLDRVDSSEAYTLDLEARLAAAEQWMSAFPPNLDGKLSRKMTEDRARAELVMELEPLAAEWEKHHVATEEQLADAECERDEARGRLERISKLANKRLCMADPAIVDMIYRLATEKGE